MHMSRIPYISVNGIGGVPRVGIVGPVSIGSRVSELKYRYTCKCAGEISICPPWQPLDVPLCVHSGTMRPWILVANGSCVTTTTTTQRPCCLQPLS